MVLAVTVATAGCGTAFAVMSTPIPGHMSSAARTCLTGQGRTYRPVRQGFEQSGTRYAAGTEPWPINSPLQVFGINRHAHLSRHGDSLDAMPAPSTVPQPERVPTCTTSSARAGSSTQVSSRPHVGQAASRGPAALLKPVGWVHARRCSGPEPTLVYTPRQYVTLCDSLRVG